MDQDDNGCETITLDGSASSDPELKSLSYEWFQFISERIGTGPTLTKCFPVGSRTVDLRVTDPDGKSNTASVAVAVTPKKPTLLSPSNGDSFSLSSPPTLCWGKINSASSYYVGLWREDESPAKNPRASGYISDTCWTPTMLDPNYTYFWAVDAYGGDTVVRSETSEDPLVQDHR